MLPTTPILNDGEDVLVGTVADMRTPIAVGMCCAAIFALAMVGGADARTVTKGVQLDRDAPLERVVREYVDCPAGLNVPQIPEACGTIRIVDGARSQRITPLDQLPRHDYGWYPSFPRFADLTGDGRPEVIWSLSTSGGTGSSPGAVGVHRWNSRSAKRIFYRSPSGGRTQSSRLRILPKRRGRRELQLVEYVRASGDATCCPTFRRTRRYRYDGRRMAPVKGSTHLRRN